MAEKTFHKALRESTMKCCNDCVISGRVITDYDVTEMTRTPQGWKCLRHSKSWSERRRNALRRSASTTIKAIVK